MKKIFKKHFISSLSFMLILSNFSFATTYIYCNMQKEGTPACQVCVHIYNNKADFTTASLTRTPCCGELTREISNSNILNTVKSEINSNALSVIGTIHSSGFNNCIYSAYCSSNLLPYLHEQIPKTDIPISTSSLLI